MNLSKLTRWHVIGIWASVAVVLGLVWFFALFKPVNENITRVRGEIDGYEKTIHDCITTLPQDDRQPLTVHDGFSTKLISSKDSKYQKDLEQAVADNAKLKDQLAHWKNSLYVIKFTKAEGDFAAWKTVMHEFHEVIAPAFDEFMRGDQNVRVSYNFQPDVPPAMWTSLKAPSSSFIKLPSGGQIEVQVQGSYTQIINFINRLTSWNRLIPIGNIKLTGLSPNITATFPVNIYILADVPETILASGGGGAGAPGMGGGMMPGMGGGGLMGGMKGGAGAAPVGGAGEAGAESPPPSAAPAGGGSGKGEEDLGGGGGLGGGRLGGLRGSGGE